MDIYAACILNSVRKVIKPEGELKERSSELKVNDFCLKSISNVKAVPRAIVKIKLHSATPQLKCRVKPLAERLNVAQNMNTMICYSRYDFYNFTNHDA